MRCPNSVCNIYDSENRLCAAVLSAYTVQKTGVGNTERNCNIVKNDYNLKHLFSM